MEKSKRMSWKDGWHEWGQLNYYIEDGRLLRGVWNGAPVYPYLPAFEKYGGGWDSAYGIRANKRNFNRVSWF